jgi:hypothetical protein
MTTNEDLAKRDKNGRMMALYEKHKKELYGEEEDY